MEEKMISLIIPVYNAEKYLEECIDSVLKQEYENYEVILINDGSKDSSEEICLAYEKKDSKIKYIYQENSGVSSARNRGLEIANGKIIVFLDSDDLLEPNALNIIGENFKSNELLCFGYYKLYKTRKEKCIINNNNVIVDKQSIITDSNISGYLWNKAFDSTIIKNNNLYFDKKIHYCEDLLFVSEYIKYCSKISYIDNTLYNYRVRKSSVTGQFNNKKNISILYSYEKLLTLYNNEEKALNEIKFNYLLSYYKLKNIIDDTYIINEKIINEEKIIIKGKKLKEKLKYYLIKKIPKIYEKIKQIKMKSSKMFE